MIEADYLQKVLGDKFMVNKIPYYPRGYEIITLYQIPNNDLIPVYYNPETRILSDGQGSDFEMGLFNDDWDKIDYVKAMLKTNGINIGEDKELSKMVKSDFANEFDNFAKVIADIVAYVVNDMMQLIEKGES